MELQRTIAVAASGNPTAASATAVAPAEGSCFSLLYFLSNFDVLYVG
jgi:hypothetical protein